MAEGLNGQQLLSRPALLAFLRDGGPPVGEFGIEPAGERVQARVGPLDAAVAQCPPGHGFARRGQPEGNQGRLDASLVPGAGNNTPDGTGRCCQIRWDRGVAGPRDRTVPDRDPGPGPLVLIRSVLVPMPVRADRAAATSASVARTYVIVTVPVSPLPSVWPA